MGSPIIWAGNAARLLKSALQLPGSTSGTLTVQPAAATTSHTLTMPAAQGTSNTVLTNDGSGGLSWAANGSSLIAVTTVTTTYSILTSDGLIICNTAGGAFTVTLPNAVGILGKRYVITKGDASTNILTVATTSSQTMDGVTTIRMATQGDDLVVISDGSNWRVEEYAVRTTATYTGGNGAAVAANGVVNFQTVVYDALGLVTNPTTSWRFTAPVSGTYAFSGQLYVSPGAQSACYYSLNGVSTTGAGTFYFAGTGTAGDSATIALVTQLAANDFVQFRIAGSTQTVSNSILNFISVTRTGS